MAYDVHLFACPNCLAHFRHKFLFFCRMAPVQLTLKVMSLGEIKPILNTYIFLDGDDTSQHLRSVIRSEVNKVHGNMPFSATNDDILDITASGGIDVAQMLDRPMSVFPTHFREVVVKINPVPAVEVTENNEPLVDLVKENQTLMSFLTHKYSNEHTLGTKW